MSSLYEVVRVLCVFRMVIPYHTRLFAIRSRGSIEWKCKEQMKSLVNEDFLQKPTSQTHGNWHSFPLVPVQLSAVCVKTDNWGFFLARQLIHSPCTNSRKPAEDPGTAVGTTPSEWAWSTKSQLFSAFPCVCPFFTPSLPHSGFQDKTVLNSVTENIFPFWELPFHSDVPFGVQGLSFQEVKFVYFWLINCMCLWHSSQETLTCLKTEFCFL